MKHTLTPRRKDYETSTLDDSPLLSEEFPQRDSCSQEELQNGPDARGRPPLIGSPEERVRQLKHAAKLLKKATGMRSCEAHESMARYYGYRTYNAFLADICPWTE